MGAVESSILRITAASDWAAAAADLVRTARVLGVPTGTTPLPLYRELRRRAQAREWDPSPLRWVMVDDYLDASSLPTNSCQWLRRELFEPLAVPEERILRIPTESRGIAAACEQFERRLAEWGGCDLLLLGLGANGHVAFNEPGSPANSRTRVVKLAAQTSDANAAYWDGSFRPRQAVTMGIATMLAAERICLLVRGAAKADILRRAWLGPVAPDVPASLLRQSPSLLVLADRDAAGQLE